MANMDDLSKKAQALFGANKTKVQDALKSEKAEGISDKLLDGASNLAKKVSGGKHDEKIDKARTQADKHLGNE
ncbi:MAG: hypothetical protein JWQ43_3202 [Glaciihabitans sp.]|nr:hypothetical protein [Glaciihabitans sp.]